MQQTLFRIRDKRNKDWFWMDNEYLNGLGKHFGPICIAVYVSLCRHANNESQSCFPSQKLMSEELGTSERTVRTYLKILEKHHVISLKKERTQKGKWLNNVYYLLDKSEWIYPSAIASAGQQPSANKDTAIGKQTQDHRHQIPLNKTNNNNTNTNKTNLVAQSATGKETNDLIDLFKAVNPAWERLFAQKPQRAAIERLVKKIGREKVAGGINILPKTNSMDYSPKIFTPCELERKLGALIAFVKKEGNKINKNKIGIL